MAHAGRDAAQKAGNQLDLASALAVIASILWLKGEREETAATNSLTPPRPLALLANSAQLGPTDAGWRAIGI